MLNKGTCSFYSPFSILLFLKWQFQYFPQMHVLNSDLVVHACVSVGLSGLYRMSVMLLATRPASMTRCLPNTHLSNYTCVHGTCRYILPLNVTLFVLKSYWNKTKYLPENHHLCFLIRACARVWGAGCGNFFEGWPDFAQQGFMSRS